MKKTVKNMNDFVESTIRGFSRTLELAKEDGWTFTQMMDSLDLDHNLCLGALIYGNIYDGGIDDETFHSMRDRLHEAKWEVIRNF